MSSIKKKLSNCKHPNSRKTLALTKQLAKSNNRNKQKVGQYMKQNLIGERILWFRDNLDSKVSICTPEILDDLLKKYMTRFDDELEQISLKHSIGGRKNRQHASREDILKMNKKRELEEYNTCGIEIPDFLDNHNLTVVRKWDGELRFLQNIKLKRYGKKHIQELINNAKKIANKERKKDENKDKQDAQEGRKNIVDSCIENMDIDN